MKKLLLSSLLLTAVVIVGVRVDFALNPHHRTAAIQGLCKAGLPNLSRPAGIDADDLDCVVLGPKRGVSGFMLGQYHGRTLIVGDAIRFDDQGAFANELLDVAGGTDRSSRGWDDLRDMASSAPEVCLLTIWRVTMDGWSTETEGPYGYAGWPSRGFFADRLVSIETVTSEQVAEVDARMREYACIWTGEGEWLHLGSDSRLAARDHLAPPTPHP